MGARCTTSKAMSIVHTRDDTHFNNGNGEKSANLRNIEEAKLAGVVLAWDMDLKERGMSRRIQWVK